MLLSPNTVSCYILQLDLILSMEQKLSLIIFLNKKLLDNLSFNIQYFSFVLIMEFKLYWTVEKIVQMTMMVDYILISRKFFLK